MRKYLLAVLIILWAIVLLPRLNRGVCPFRPRAAISKIESIKKTKQDAFVDKAFLLLKARKDKDALAIFEKILLEQPDNLACLWGKAEVLRRMRQYPQSERMVQEILKKNPNHTPALITLSYIRYKEERLNEASKLIEQVLKNDTLTRDDEALAYMMLGTINSRRATTGWFLNKVRYGTQIKCYFLKARGLAPDLAEVHLALGTFYLKGPLIVGGNLHKAIEELEIAVKIAPDFATPNARLAQAYQKKGDLKKYSFYLKRAKSLEPENEVLKEIETK
ncbi:MAG: tetratricopeptide repeat protein [Candidatus Omnitrophota bacterium]|jgi:tetratricopeptide (TPR) repeat protein